MTSIRHHIQLRLLPGFLLLWIGAGGVLYLSIKQRYEVELDADLRELWAALPFGNQPHYPGMVTIDDFEKDDFGIYFQIWNQQGDRILKSDNLGRLDLPKPKFFDETPVYKNMLLENGDPVRSLSVGVTGLGALGNLRIVVAKTREKAITSERRILLAIFGIGSLTGVIFTLLLGYSIRSGLKPLERIGNKATRIDGESLSERFPDEGLPSEVKPIVDRLNDLMARLETSFSREKRFSADLAHELRTPVSALRSIVEVALKWPEQATHENYEDIDVISRELQTTIENLLTLARLDKATGQVKLTGVTLGKLIQSAWEPFAEMAAERDLKFQSRIDPTKTINTDPKLFHLILSNLFSNAVSYAPSDTVIELYQDDSSILILKNRAEHLVKADVEKMFDRLWRHDLARSDSSHSGLGLSIAKTSAEVLSLTLRADLEDKSIRFTLKSNEEDERS